MVAYLLAYASIVCVCACLCNMQATIVGVTMVCMNVLHMVFRRLCECDFVSSLSFVRVSVLLILLC